MKIALCLSGQPRSFRKSIDYYRRNLLSRWPCDTFIHTWLHGDLADYNALLKLFMPTSARIDAPVPEHAYARYTRVDDPRFPARNSYHMHYSIHAANALKQEHEERYGFNYDFVIRARFDYALNIVLDFATMEPGSLYLPGGHPATVSRGVYNDMFACGDSATMDAYASTFVNIGRLYDDGVCMNGEDMLAANIRYHGLVDRLIFLDMKSPFPANAYSGIPDCIIRDDFTTWNKHRRPPGVAERATKNVKRLARFLFRRRT